MAGWAPNPEFFTTPVGLAVLAIVSLLVTGLFLYALSRIVYEISHRLLPRLRWLGSKVVPEGPAGMMAALLVFATVTVFGASIPLSDSVGPFGENPDNAAAGTASGFLDEAFEEGEIRRTDGGAIMLGSGSYERPQPDTAGDRLRDDWLRDGKLPEGAPLSGGSVDRLDLYVYVVHGSNVEPLTDRERRQLRTVWNEMPVSNPDGSTGVDVHVESGGELNGSVRFDDDSDPTSYYESALPSARQCRHHLVVLGQPTGSIAGLGTSPGYSSLVTGERWSEYEGDVSYRVGVTTHELLHNVVGRMDDPGLPDDGAHTRGGWLDHDGRHGDDEYLSSTVAETLNESRFRGSGLYQNEVCGGGE